MTGNILNPTRSVGVILPHVGPSQLAEEVFSAMTGDDMYSIYYERVAVPYRPTVIPLHTVSECLFFSGRLIGTTLFSMNYVLSSLQKIESVFYIYDLEFLRGKTNYMDNLKIYRNQELKIYTRSEEYAKIFKNYANRDIEVKSIRDVINMR